MATGRASISACIDTILPCVIQSTIWLTLNCLNNYVNLTARWWCKMFFHNDFKQSTPILIFFDKSIIWSFRQVKAGNCMIWVADYPLYLWGVEIWPSIILKDASLSINAVLFTHLIIRRLNTILMESYMLNAELGIYLTPTKSYCFDCAWQNCTFWVPVTH